MELAILMLCEIFKISVMVLCENFLWKSEERSLDEFYMYFIMFKTSRFMSASKRSGQKFLLQMPHTLQQFLTSTLNNNVNGNLHQEYQITPKKKWGHPKKNINDTTVTVNSSDVSASTTVDGSIECGKDSWDMNNTKFWVGQYYPFSAIIWNEVYSWLAEVSDIYSITFYSQVTRCRSGCYFPRNYSAVTLQNCIRC